MGNFTKKYLTIDDLLSFCMQSKLDNFSAKDAGGPIIVQSFGKIKTEDTTTMGLTPCTLMACHTELNRNKSFIEESVMNNALASFSNRPILGYIHQLEDGTWNFWDHRVSIEEDGDETRIEYLESPIGVIPESCNAHLEYDEEHDKNYVVVNGFLYDDYGNRAIEIIQENGGNVDVSVELAINSMSYNAKENYLNIEDFTFMGVTCLGKTPDGTIVHPGMEGANLKLDNFSATQNSMFSNDCQNKMIEILEKLNDTLSNFNTNIQKGGNVKMNTFEILLEKYGKTVEDVTFDTEGLSDEELEEKFKEAFEDNDGDDTTNPEGDSADESSDAGDGDNSDDGNGDDTIGGNDGENSDSNGEDTGSGEPEGQSEEKFVLKYELSHDDIRSALYSLLAAESDEDYCYDWIIEVFDDKFIYQDYMENKFYRRGYSKDDENVALDETKVEVFNEWLSQVEKDALDALKADYAALKQFKADADAAQLKAQKDAVFAREEFAGIANTKAFKKLIENSKDYTIEECEQKAKDILEACNDFATNFAAKDEGSNKPDTFAFNFNKKESKKGPYGNLFNKD